MYGTPSQANVRPPTSRKLYQPSEEIDPDVKAQFQQDEINRLKKQVRFLTVSQPCLECGSQNHATSSCTNLKQVQAAESYEEMNYMRGPYRNQNTYQARNDRGNYPPQQEQRVPPYRPPGFQQAAPQDDVMRCLDAKLQRLQEGILQGMRTDMNNQLKGVLQLEKEILDFCQGLRVMGVKPDERVALFSDNSCRWFIADQGIMATGAINVVRGSRSSAEELLQIYNHSQSMALIVDSPELFNHVAQPFSLHATSKFVILLWGEKSHLKREVLEKFSVVTYTEIIELGHESREALVKSDDASKQYTYEDIHSDDIATLIYTSGTTGNPKGVMLTHQNLLHQIKNFWEVVPAEAGDRFLSMLPPWHAYERAIEYLSFANGVEQMYTMVKYLKDDLKKYQPHYLISVPSVYETLYSGIQKQLSATSVLRKFIAFTLISISLTFMEFKRVYEGKYLRRCKEPEFFLAPLVDWMWAGAIAAILWPIHVLAEKIIYSRIKSAIGISKAGISGGGSLPLHVDKFFEAIGILVQNGYGLTETSPVVACRRASCNVLGSVGHTQRGAEVKVVNAETNETLPPGSRGIVKVRGELVMKGYSRNPLATEKVLDEDGWLDTGDLGWIAPHHSRGQSRLCGGVLVLEGRAKDTIVLMTGENVEPQEIEAAAIRSMLVHQIVVVGQDQRRLGAIIVPNKEEALAAAKKLSLVNDDATELSKETLTNMLSQELRIWTSSCSLKVGPILIADEAFTIDNGLTTPTLKVRRDRVAHRYRDQIAEMFK